MVTKQERIALLERQVARLQRRIEILDNRSTRYGWARVLIFFAGLLVSISGAIVIGWWLGVALLLVTIVAFGIVAHYHGQLDRSLTRHTIWQQIKMSQVARMKLDWAHIPDLGESETPEEHPFASDLDITGPHSLHRLLNVAISQEGNSRLKSWLLATRPDYAATMRRQSQVRELATMTTFRNKLMMHSLFASRRLKEQLQGQRLVKWLAEGEPARKLLPTLLGSIVLQVATIVTFLSGLFVSLPQIWVFTILGALYLFFATAKKRGDVFEDASYLRYGFATLSSIFSFLEQYPYGQSQHIKTLCEPFYRDRKHGPSLLLQQTARVSSLATLKNSPLVWIIVNALVPWDIYCAYRLRQYKERIAERLPEWLDGWYELEALSSLATFAYLNPEYRMPDVERREQGVLFEARDLGHPLIQAEKKVTNDFTFAKTGEVVIITGSNMAGKSTFLRTLGMNLCLAYAGGPVNATSLNTALFRLFTCIRVSDSVTDGYSYFYSEVRRLRALLDELARPGEPLLFLIDEIFKGTNNRERLIGSRSFVRALVGRNCLGAISTHDLELVKLEETVPEVHNYHFREHVVDGQMVFDYQLRSGPCPTTNALKIMQMEGLPIEEQG